MAYSDEHKETLATFKSAVLSEDEWGDVVCEISGDYDAGLRPAIERVLTNRLHWMAAYNGKVRDHYVEVDADAQAYFFATEDHA